MKDPTKEAVKRAALAGVGALSGLRSAHGPAQLAARIPYVGHAVAVVVLAGGAILGAAKAASQAES